MDKETKDFITLHKLDESDFVDAKGCSVKLLYKEMKANEILFAYNTVPCSNFGHTLRDRNGNCLMCNTAYIAFSLRKKKIGHIYIACSLKREFTKVGMTTEKIESRLSKLNSRNVGNTQDWEIISSIKCARANSIELLIHKKLEKYKVQGDYYGNTESKEIFRCSYEKAKELLDLILKEEKVKILEKKFYVGNEDRYKFRNLVSKRE